MNGAGGVALGVHAHVLEDALEQGLLVVRVVDDEVVGDADGLAVPKREAHALEGVNRGAVPTGIMLRQLADFEHGRDGEQPRRGERRAHGAGFQQATRWAPAPNGGVSARQRSSGRAQRGAKAQPRPRAPGAGTVPAIDGRREPGGLIAGMVSSSALV